MKAIRWLATGVVALWLGGCATPSAPLRFELVDDQARVHPGSYDPQTHGMTVGIGERVYNGFYVLAAESVSTTSFPPFSRRPFPPVETRGIVVSNQARAHLRSVEGDHLACEFTIDGARAVGTCKSATGKTFQFVAGQ